MKETVSRFKATVYSTPSCFTIKKNRQKNHSNNSGFITSYSSTRTVFNADKQGNENFVLFLPHLTTSHLQRCVSNEQNMVMNNDLGNMPLFI